jgi:hypothetical protein
MASRPRSAEKANTKVYQRYRRNPPPRVVNTSCEIWGARAQMTSEYKSAKLHYEARTRAEALAAALSNQSTASLKVGFIAGLTDEQKAAALAYEGEDGPVGPAEGQGERGEEQSRRERESEAFDQWWKSSGHADEPAYTLTVETACHRAWQERASRAIPPAPQPQPLKGAVKVSDIIHQIALWADDEGLELSMGQGEDLARRIRSALSTPEPSDEQG